ISRTTLTSGPGTPEEDVLMFGATVFFAAVGRSPWGDGAVAAVPVARPCAAGPPADPDLTGCPPLLAPIVRACLTADAAAHPPAAKLHARVGGGRDRPAAAVVAARPGRRAGHRVPGAPALPWPVPLAARARPVTSGSA